MVLMMLPRRLLTRTGRSPGNSGFRAAVNAPSSPRWDCANEAAHVWFAQKLALGGCPFTQVGFLRLSPQPAVTKVPLVLADALEALAQFTADPDDCFWPWKPGDADIREEMRTRIAGHRRLTDTMLLKLAIRHEGRLATFDGKIQALLPPGLATREAVAIIPV